MWHTRSETVPACVKLNSYMNVSGGPVARLVSESNLKPEEILICYDDFDLPLGTIRLRKKGSAGSHNGLKSIIEKLQSQDFPRLRMGIGPMPRNVDPAEFVLCPFHRKDEEAVSRMVEKAAEAVSAIVKEGIDSAMNQFNK